MQYPILLVSGAIAHTFFFLVSGYPVSTFLPTIPFIYNAPVIQMLEKQGVWPSG